MKGIIFTEFLELVEARYSPAHVENMIDRAELPSKGAYTTVGTYPYQEMVSLVSVLSKQTGAPIPSIMKLYGEHLFERLREKYPQFFNETTNAFDFLAGIQTCIHKEVKKLYSDARLPTFEVERHEPSHFSMIYSSERPFGDLCEGLIIGCLNSFGETADIVRSDLQSAPVTRVRFEITKAGP